jgi:PAS domain S-box-containing protein
MFDDGNQATGATTMLLHPRDGASETDGVSTKFATTIARESRPFESSSSDLENRDAVAREVQRVGRFRFYIDGQRWEWSESVERLHGYEPGTVTPTTELLLSHKHPDDRPQVAAVLDKVADGEPFTSRHRIIDTAGRTHWVIVIGDRMLDEAGELVGTSGFYVDFTDTMQSDISAAVSKVAQARAEIEQAKGLLMATYGISADRAFDILVWRSQETNVKVRELARRFLAAMAGTFPADTRTKVDHVLLNIS